MSVAAVVLLSVGIAAQRLVGMFLIGNRLDERPTLRRLVDLLPAGVIAAVIAQQTFARGTSLEIDARLPGVAVAAVLVWRGQSLGIVVIAAAAVTAAVRLVS